MRITIMKRFFFSFIFFVTVGIGGLFALKALQPDAFDSLMLTFELTPNSKEEKARLDRINLLPISDEKKKILTNRTIFLGASPRMAELALGEPIQRRGNHDQTPTVDQWIYYFADDSRPTVLEFEDSKLAKAYKISAHKLNLSSAQPSTDAEAAQ